MNQILASAPVRQLAALGLVLALAGCAAIEANRRAPGVVAAGTFTPARAASTRLGPDATRVCPVGGVYDETETQVQKAVADRGATPAKQDGQLCAVAEAFLAWDPEAPPREAVRTFAARHVGLASTPQIILTTLESEDSRQLGEGVSKTVLQYANQVPVPHYGIATDRLSKGRTRVVIVLDNPRVALDPLPRRLELGEKATLSGKVLGELENPKLVISDSQGVVTEPAQAPGKAFKADLACGAKGGHQVIEIRAEDMGSETLVATLVVPCGGPPLPTSVAVAPAPWPEAVAEQEARVAKAIDAERAEGGLPALAWSDVLAKIARAVSENNRDAAKKGGVSTPVNIVQRLGDADIQARVVLQNPAAGPSAEVASERLLLSPPHRATIMSTEVGTAGVGVAMGTDQAGRPVAFLTQLFIYVQPPPDVAAAKREVVQIIAKKRAEEKLPALASDAELEKLAGEYAVALAAAGGPPPKAVTEEFEKALKKGYRDLVIMRDARFDLNDYAEDPNLLTPKGKVYGLGAALGRHPRLGKNTLFVVVVIGSKLPGKK